MRINLKCSCFLLRSLGLLFFFFQSLTITILQQIGKVHDHQYRVLLCNRMFGDIPRNVWRHSPECLRTFLGMFEGIPRNVWWTFPGIFGDVAQNVWQHFPEYNFPPIPRVPRIPFSVSVFLVLYIADFHLKKTKMFLNRLSLYSCITKALTWMTCTIFLSRNK